MVRVRATQKKHHFRLQFHSFKQLIINYHDRTYRLSIEKHKTIQIKGIQGIYDRKQYTTTREMINKKTTRCSQKIDIDNTYTNTYIDEYNNIARCNDSKY